MSLDTYVWETESSFLRQDKEKCDGKTVVKGIGTRDKSFTKEKTQSCSFAKKIEMCIPLSSSLNICENSGQWGT